MVILTDNGTCVTRDCDRAPDGINPDGSQSASCQECNDRWWGRLNRHISKAPPPPPPIPVVSEEEQCVEVGCVARRDWPHERCEEHHG